jgi:N-acetylated-alpha-linked acidic dipeptidase
VAPRVEPRVPYFDFSPLEAAVDSLSGAAREFQRAAAEAHVGADADRSRVAAANAAIRAVERAMTRPEGLPGRPWFRHYVYAPGFYTGYDVKTLPAVREAIEQKQWPAVNGEIVKTAAAIEAAAARIREAAEKLKS